jgi:hypothetical protein
MVWQDSMYLIEKVMCLFELFNRNWSGSRDRSLVCQYL